LCWAGFWSWYYRVLSCGRLHGDEPISLGWHCDGPILADGEYYVVPLPVMVAVMIGIPLAVLVVGFALRWIALAFQRREPTEGG